MTDELEGVRRAFASQLRDSCRLRSDALVEALAAVPRERYLPPGPWTVRGEAAAAFALTTPDADPRHVYQDVSIAIDAGRHLFNGAPGVVLHWIDALPLRAGDRVLHIGCGLGYYTALMAHVVGPGARVLAIEVDTLVARAASRNLEDASAVEVRCGDGTGLGRERFDAIVVSAGVTHVEEGWISALAPGGRMILPLTATFPQLGPLGKGFVVRIARRPCARPIPGDPAVDRDDLLRARHPRRRDERATRAGHAAGRTAGGDGAATRRARADASLLAARTRLVPVRQCLKNGWETSGRGLVREARAGRHRQGTSRNWPENKRKGPPGVVMKQPPDGPG